jgi:hypothetical protein
MMNSCWSIAGNAYSEFINFIRYLELDNFSRITLSDCDIEFEKSNYTEVKYKNNPKSALVRFNFLEILVRLALNKYKN